MRVTAAAGQVTEAEALLAALVSRGIDPKAEASLRRSIDEAAGGDAASLREAQFEADQSIENLLNLVMVLEAERHWDRLVRYARRLFDETRDLSAAKTYVRALSECDMYSSVVEFLDDKQNLIDQSDFLLSQYSWALYHDGNLARASEMLGRLRSTRDRPNDRTLFVNIAICSGNWDSLLPFVESEWVNRADREPQELLEGWPVGNAAGIAESEGLVVEAARTGSDDPRVLLGCYGAAVKGSWEETEQVHEWMQRAADLSDPEGPIQKISFDEIAERKPKWEKREDHVWELPHQEERRCFRRPTRSIGL